MSPDTKPAKHGTLKLSQWIRKRAAVELGRLQYAEHDALGIGDHGERSDVGDFGAGNDHASAGVGCFSQCVADVLHLKVDVQGGEAGVLRSSQTILYNDRVDLMFVEHSGEPEVMGILASYSVIIYDSEYLLIPTRPEANTAAWDVISELRLSTGQRALRAWPRNAPSKPDAYCGFIAEQRKSIGHVSTDLVCVSGRFHGQFLEAAKRAAVEGNSIANR